MSHLRNDSGAPGFIDRRDLSRQLEIWVGVEPFDSQEKGKARAAELQQANPGYEYRAEPFLELPIWVTRKTTIQDV
ncbi:hypothetical protein D3C85_1386830 [compost metagenome]